MISTCLLAITTNQMGAINWPIGQLVINCLSHFSLTYFRAVYDEQNSFRTFLVFHSFHHERRLNIINDFTELLHIVGCARIGTELT